jgi:hypothetical protein
MSGAILAAAAAIGGASGPLVSLTNQTVTSNAASPSQATSTYELNSSGVINRIVNGSTTALGNWLTPASGMSGYDARATQTFTNSNGTLSPALSTGVPSAWLNLGTTRSWQLQTDGSGAGLAARTLTIEIRNTSTLTVLATATITLNATDLP